MGLPSLCLSQALPFGMFCAFVECVATGSQLSVLAFGTSHQIQFPCAVKDFQLKLYVFRLANNNKND